MQLPNTLGGLLIWGAALIVIAIVAVFLFQNIVLPFLKTIT